MSSIGKELEVKGRADFWKSGLLVRAVPITQLLGWLHSWTLGAPASTAATASPHPPQARGFASWRLTPMPIRQLEGFHHDLAPFTWDREDWGQEELMSSSSANCPDHSGVSSSCGSSLCLPLPFLRLGFHWHLLRGAPEPSGKHPGSFQALSFPCFFIQRTLVSSTNPHMEQHFQLGWRMHCGKVLGQRVFLAYEMLCTLSRMVVVLAETEG